MIDRPWLSSYDADVPTPLSYADEPLFALLDRAAAEHPDREAVSFQGRGLSYAELHRLAERGAAGLLAMGVKPGDHVGIMLPNLPQFIIAYWAVLKAGCVGVPVNPAYNEHELNHQLNDAGIKTLIVLDLVLDKVWALKDRVPVERYVVCGIEHGLSWLKGKLYKLKMWRAGKLPTVLDDQRIHGWQELLAPRRGYSHAGVKGSDLALLLYTGGTTGLAKGCMLTHANLGANITQILAILYVFVHGEQRFLSLTPFFHSYGLTVSLHLPTALAATVLPLPRFVPAETLKTIERLKPTIFPGAPSVYIALMHQKSIGTTDMSSLRYCVSGSAPMPEDSLARFKDIFSAELLEGYGLTEASPVTHLNPVKNCRKLGSIGLPFPDTDAKVVEIDNPDVEVQPGQCGELLIRGPQVMAGYWNQPEETAAVLQNGWLRTGDMAVMDDDGYFFIVGRQKDLIITAGFNVYPREVDEVLHTHPKVREAACIGVPHSTRGEIVKAFVVPVDGASLDKAEVVAFCRSKLAHYKVPREVEIVPELPKSVLGKVLRRELRKMVA